MICKIINDDLTNRPSWVCPLQMIADPIRDRLGRSKLVLYAFRGSGSTLTAAEKTGRRFRLRVSA